MERLWPKNIVVRYLLLALILAPHFFPYYLTRVTIVGRYMSQILMGSIAALLIFFIPSMIKIRINVLHFLLPLFAMSRMLSTYLAGRSPIPNALFWAKVFASCLIVEASQEDEEMGEIFLRVVRDLTLIIFVLNIISAIIYPGGIPRISSQDFPNYLFGNPNSTIRTIYFGFCSACILDAKKERLSLLTMIFPIGFVYLSATTYIMATGLVAMCLITLLIILRKYVQKWLRWIYLAVITAVAFVETTVVVMNRDWAREGLAKLFHKSSTFSNRFELWRAGLKLIPYRLLTGFGEVGEVSWYKRVGNRFGTHNYYLDIAIDQGLLGVGILLFIIILPIFLIRKKSIRRESYVLATFSCGLYMMFLFEPYYRLEYLTFPIIHMFLQSLIKEKNNGLDVKVFQSCVEDA